MRLPGRDAVLAILMMCATFGIDLVKMELMNGQ